jgi:hypothetical protein
MEPHPDEGAFTTWLLTLYGATMLGVQHLENAVKYLYLVVRIDPERRSNASPQRQWRNAFAGSWRAFQTGSAGMKLNDAAADLRSHLEPDFFEELDAFIKGPRVQLSHRFLIERLPDVDAQGLPHLAGAAADLIGLYSTAMRLANHVLRRANEIRDAWPSGSEPPDEVRAMLDRFARMTILKQFPRAFLDQAETARAERDVEIERFRRATQNRSRRSDAPEASSDEEADQ